jgi:SAM-dependent methyltransferase
VATLLPFGRDDTFTVVEAGSGEGALGATILGSYPGARVVALDGSESMRRATRAGLARFEGRFDIHGFDLFEGAWWSHLDGADALVSSLVVHHLDGPGKRRLYREAASRLSERGALVIADLVAPVTEVAAEVFAATWDEETRAAARRAGNERIYDAFVDTQWNIYRHPDPMDKPSPLRDNLAWLIDAGFGGVDCFWLRAGHAVYGGFKQPDATRRIDYADALDAARASLER